MLAVQAGENWFHAYMKVHILFVTWTVFTLLFILPVSNFVGFFVNCINSWRVGCSRHGFSDKRKWEPEINSSWTGRFVFNITSYHLWTTLWQVLSYLAWLQFWWLAPIFSSFGTVVIQLLIPSINCKFWMRKPWCNQWLITQSPKYDIYCECLCKDWTFGV